MLSDSYWQQPLQWDRAAQRAGERRRVFCSSMADVFEDHPTNNRERPRLWDLIAATPNLDWLLLTKRPENIGRMVPADWGDGYPNVWLGTTVESQEYADKRIPELIKVPAVVRFLSVEPMLSSVNLSPWLGTYLNGAGDWTFIGFPGLVPVRIQWVIVGCESGPKRRPFDVTAAQDLVAQCKAAGVACFVKQVIVDGKVCHDVEKFRPGLQVRQFPTPQRTSEPATIWG